MRMRPGAERWCRLLLVVLLALPIPATLDTAADHGWMAGSDPAESDEDRLRLAAGAPSGSAWTLPAPTPARPASRQDSRAPVVARWTGLTPTDRAPPRA
jgi:hypothetical protein